MACEPLEIWGDGQKGRDIIYVKDVVSAFIQSIEIESVSGLYNITSGEYLTLRQQAELTAQLFWGSDTVPEFVELPEKKNNIDAFLYDNTKAQSELNWCPQYSFQDMLLDYKKESEEQRYRYLIDKRKSMFQ